MKVKKDPMVIDYAYGWSPEREEAAAQRRLTAKENASLVAKRKRALKAAAVYARSKINAEKAAMLAYKKSMAADKEARRAEAEKKRKLRAHIARMVEANKAAIHNQPAIIYPEPTGGGIAAALREALRRKREGQV